MEFRRARENSFERLNMSPVSQVGSFERREPLIYLQFPRLEVLKDVTNLSITLNCHLFQKFTVFIIRKRNMIFQGLAALMVCNVMKAHQRK